MYSHRNRRTANQITVYSHRNRRTANQLRMYEVRLLSVKSNCARLLQSCWTLNQIAKCLRRNRRISNHTRVFEVRLLSRKIYSPRACTGTAEQQISFRMLTANLLSVKSIRRFSPPVKSIAINPIGVRSNTLVKYHLTCKIKTNHYIHSCQVPLDMGIYCLLFNILVKCHLTCVFIPYFFTILSSTTWHAQLQSRIYTQNYR